MNQDWHRQNKLARHAKLDDRLKWHREHQRSCGCRPIPQSLQLALKDVDDRP